MKNYCKTCGKEIDSRSKSCRECTKTTFKKGNVPWNKGKKGFIPWNKGLTKKDPRVKDNIEKMHKALEFKKTWGLLPKVKFTKERCKKISDRMKGDKNPAKRPEVREKIRKSVLRHYKEHPETLENRKPCGINQYSNRFTSIEEKIADELDKRNIGYKHNYKIGRYHVDFLIWDRIVIECDGEYWHRNKQEYDAKRTEYIQDKGFFVFNLSERNINNGSEQCMSWIKSVMESLDSVATRQLVGFNFSII